MFDSNDRSPPLLSLSPASPRARFIKEDSTLLLVPCPSPSRPFFLFRSAAFFFPSFSPLAAGKEKARNGPPSPQHSAILPFPRRHASPDAAAFGSRRIARTLLALLARPLEACPLGLLCAPPKQEEKKTATARRPPLVPLLKYTLVPPRPPRLPPACPSRLHPHSTSASHHEPCTFENRTQKPAPGARSRLLLFLRTRARARHARPLSLDPHPRSRPHFPAPELYTHPSLSCLVCSSLPLRERPKTISSHLLGSLAAAARTPPPPPPFPHPLR